MHTVTYDENQKLILMTLKGEVTPEEQKRLIGETETIIVPLRAQGKPVLILSDVSEANPPSFKVRSDASDILTKVDFDKLAMFTTNRFVGFILRMIARFAVGNKQVKVFKSQDNATKWLKEKSA